MTSSTGGRPLLLAHRLRKRISANSRDSGLRKRHRAGLSRRAWVDRNNGLEAAMNIYSPGLLQELANDLFLVFAIGLMLFIPIGQYFRWVGLIREKHRFPSLSLLLSLFGLTAIASYVLG